ncbi:hypothetical protein CMV_023792 [Castanea mollissima]|uniref:Uncharacterized protein n=1 Tax=Castanea mollissima TaxID=60419 RepID=A0A8J4QPG5_9ROSI|nr:hypothetical protein CMV_023792 [Castanea mollissima]
MNGSVKIGYEGSKKILGGWADGKFNRVYREEILYKLILSISPCNQLVHPVLIFLIHVKGAAGSLMVLVNWFGA